VWEVIVRREVRPLIDALKGQRVGYGEAERQLEADPCLTWLTPEGDVRAFAYRLSGPLQPKVCGVKLKRGYRLAFTMRPGDREAHEGIVDILFVGKRDTRHRAHDVWTIVHDLFGVENPAEDHLRPPCCADEHPVIDEAELAQFLTALRRLTG
jgi:hypothetical protein